MSTSTINTSKGPGCLIELIWFVLIGWWLGQAAIALAYLLMVTVIGIPIGIVILNNLPMIVALRPAPDSLLIATTGDGRNTIVGRGAPQLPLIVRAIYFILIGWWLAAIWIEVAYALCAIIIGLPLGFWMFDKVATILTLRQD
jgi:uncharacterized membrane protein YccF (DUF307 family)